MRRFVLPCVVVALFAGPVTGQDASDDPRDAALAAFRDAWTTQDPALLTDAFTPDGEYITPAADTFHGPDGAMAYMTATFAGAPDSRLTPRTLFRQGDRAAFQWVWSGTNTAAWPDLPATGRPFTVPGVTILEFADGRIRRATDYYDRFGFLQQLGVLPPPGASEGASSDGAGGAAPGEPIALDSHGFRLAGRFFRASGDGPRPTLLLMPGFPGNPDDVIGLGAALRERGVHVVMLLPRGMHGSEGTGTFATTFDDIAAGLRWLRSDAVAARFGVDRERITLGGYSWGGGMAMAYAATDPSVRAVVSVAGTDHGEFVRLMQRNPAMAAAVRTMWDEAVVPAGPIRFDPDGIYQEMLEGQDVYGLRENADALADRRILLIGGSEDHNIPVDEILLPVYRALKEHGAQATTFLIYRASHGFGPVRDQLAADIAAWILDGADPRLSGRSSTSP